MSTFQVIRLASGDTVQIRSGVLQGLGPQGATGPQGIRGPQGEQGGPGEKGDVGYVDGFRTSGTINSSQSVAISTWTILNYTNTGDELGMWQGSNLSSADLTDVNISGWVRWANVADGGTGYRTVQIYNTTTATVLYETQVPAVYSGSTSQGFNVSVRANGGEIINVRVFHNDNEAVSVSAGAVNVYRQGSGPRGLQGNQGAIGPVGPQGPAGPTGPQGTAGSGYATIDAMGT